VKTPLKRRADDHKGRFGHVLLVAGSQGMVGAAILAARAALRSGSGLVTVALPASLQNAVAGHVPEAMTIGLPETKGFLKPEAVSKLNVPGRYTVLALGPGLSTHPDTEKFVIHALSTLPLPAVIDADALNILARLHGDSVTRLMTGRRHPSIVTPHPGEMGRCLGLSANEVQNDRRGCAIRLSREWGSVVVLKGNRTVIADGDEIAVNATGGPGLAKGGTGDVLTGVIAGLWAQAPADAFDAAVLGCRLHGLAGDLAEKELTAWAMTAQSVIDFLPAAFKKA
jgi:ADP-dependent NAD(P)H-hydrate dehydratase / NAD(P)H-hydrate epimerase